MKQPEKTERIVMAVSPEQKQKLKDAASALGLTLSGYLTFCAFERMGERMGDRLAAAAGAPSCFGCVHDCVDDDGRSRTFPCEHYVAKK